MSDELTEDEMSRGGWKRERQAGENADVGTGALAAKRSGQGLM